MSSSSSKTSKSSKSSSSGSRSASKGSPSPRSKSKQEVSLRMFPMACTCTPSFVNRTKKSAFLKLAEKLGLETEYEDEDGDWHDMDKTDLCHAINSRAWFLGLKRTKETKKTKKKHKVPKKGAPKKPAHKS
tara:strand:+ start:2815 stop:3207 length:393 start_codon:yes stop_codon:yes gene_type:complete